MGVNQNEGLKYDWEGRNWIVRRFLSGSYFCLSVSICLQVQSVELIRSRGGCKPLVLRDIEIRFYRSILVEQDDHSNTCKVLSGSILLTCCSQDKGTRYTLHHRQFIDKSNSS